jgi:Tfp pilus assembly protein PilP
MLPKKARIKKESAGRDNRILILLALLTGIFCPFSSALCESSVIQKIVGKKVTIGAKLKDIKEKSKEATYAYSPEDRIDPFAPFIVRRKSDFRSLEFDELEQLNSLKTADTELKRIKLSDFDLIAIARGKQRTWAMVSGPEGKGYVLEKGIGIGTKGGVVDKIVCEEVATPLGKEIVRKVVIKEPVVTRKGRLGYRFVDLEMGRMTAEQ